MDPRPNKHMYYLNLAHSILLRSTCLRRKYGAILVKDDVVIGTGYAGAPRGVENCTDRGSCPRDDAGVERGKDYTMCASVHAEMNAIINSNRDERVGATLYLVGIDAKTGEILQDAAPCSICARLIKNARIEEVITYAPYNMEDGPIDYLITRVLSGATYNSEDKRDLELCKTNITLRKIERDRVNFMKDVMYNVANYNWDCCYNRHTDEILETFKSHFPIAYEKIMNGERDVEIEVIADLNKRKAIDNLKGITDSNS